MIESNEKHITAGAVIYQGIRDNPQISKNELKKTITTAIEHASDYCPSRHNIFDTIISEVGY